MAAFQGFRGLICWGRRYIFSSRAARESLWYCSLSRLSVSLPHVTRPSRRDDPNNFYLHSNILKADVIGLGPAIFSLAACPHTPSRSLTVLHQQIHPSQIMHNTKIAPSAQSSYWNPIGAQEWGATGSIRTLYVSSAHCRSCWRNWGTPLTGLFHLLLLFPSSLSPSSFSRQLLFPSLPSVLSFRGLHGGTFRTHTSKWQM